MGLFTKEWRVLDGAVCRHTYRLGGACAVFAVSPTAHGTQALPASARAVDVGSGCSDAVHQIGVWCAAEVVFATQCHSSRVLSLWLVNSATFPTSKAWGFEKSVPGWLPKLVRGDPVRGRFLGVKARQICSLKTICFCRFALSSKIQILVKNIFWGTNAMDFFWQLPVLWGRGDPGYPCGACSSSGITRISLDSSEMHAPSPPQS